ncbi:MAG: twin-arginine translocase TatA/TatE family subunit [Chloroflexota bacterium]
MIPQLGAMELIIILVIIILIFGVGKLPEVGSALGKSIREFRGAADATGDDKEKESAAKPAPAAVEAPRAAASVEAPRTSAAAALAYTVQSGDTLEKIASSHGVTIEALMSANGYAQRDRVLYPGDKVQIPATA